MRYGYYGALYFDILGVEGSEANFLEGTGLPLLAHRNHLLVPAYHRSVCSGSALNENMVGKSGGTKCYYPGASDDADQAGSNCFPRSSRLG